jgi:hypothetical protein
MAASSSRISASRWPAPALAYVFRSSFDNVRLPGDFEITPARRQNGSRIVTGVRGRGKDLKLSLARIREAGFVNYPRREGQKALALITLHHATVISI